ncbi:IclR family transcriptional regulator [Thiospirochaeta perfilievii]|uniref:IclR family transcriptional regulator n=1 Tax=Thiospirochaeta perfilievii TaxID=252967 RepID=A0A5C1QA25_9SPIO|nr:IclR family transcriptional regulator [Thiospirochaeta perfilievii]QEN04327.1 IclR family transcriptional regulator [Thiospirochaeta perfilievii]
MQNRSLVRSIQILTLISQSKNGLSLNQIVEATSIPKTTVYEILLMLIETDMVQTLEGKARLYQIGLKAFVIGNRYIQNMDLVSESKPIVKRVSQELDKTIFIAILDGNQIIYLHKHEPENVPIYTANVTNREDAYCTSLGKAMLAFLPNDKLEDLIDSMNFKQRTERTILNKKSLIKELEITKKRGYAIDDREIIDFVQCLGAPIFNHRGEVVAGISTAGLYSEERDIKKEGEVLVCAAKEISTRLGYIKQTLRSYI